MGAFRRDIEGLRGVAVLVVVAFHAGLPGFGGGFVGVDVFFVISGFLITRILAGEAGGGRVHLVEFWSRRIRRLVPALTVVVLATLLLSLLVYSPLAWNDLAREAGASSLYVSNIVFARDATSYFALPLDESPYLHTWSLGVEEQFYLAWPLAFAVLALVGRARRRAGTVQPVASVALLVIVAAASFALSLWLTGRSQPWAFFSSPTRAWEFACGGLLALGSARIALGPRVASWLSWIGLLALTVAVVRYDDFTVYPGVAAVLPVAGAVALIAAGSRPGRAGADGVVLSWRPLVWLGGLSYTWYLWHWPLIVLVAAAFREPGVAARSAAALVALALAWLTTRFVEQPIRFRSPFVRSRRLTYTSGLGATACVIGVCLLVAGLADRQRTSDPTLTELAAARSDKSGITSGACDGERATRPPCAFGDVASTRTVMLLGDSHAAHWRPALDEVGKQVGVKFVMSAFGGCPAVDVPAAREGTHQLRSSCAADRARTAALMEAVDPAAVIVSQSDYLGLILDDGGDVPPTGAQRERWEAGMRDLAAQLAERRVPLGLILDVPLLDGDPIECLARGTDEDECGPDVDALEALERRAADEREALATAGHGIVFDPVPLVCTNGTCPLERDGVYVYADSEHLTRAFARRQASQLRPFVESLLA